MYMLVKFKTSKLFVLSSILWIFNMFMFCIITYC